MKKNLLTLTILAILSGTNFAQRSASLNFITAVPLGDFNNYSNDVGFGGNLEFFFFTPSEKTPYGLGINLSYLSFGAQFYDDPYSEELELSFDNANNFASAHLLFQVAPHKGTIRPYFETLFGGSYIYSLTEIGYDHDGPVNLWIDDWAWSYGAGLGLKLFITGDPFFNFGSTYIDFKVRYLFSTSAVYLDRNSVEIYYDEVYYSVIESKTDMLTASIGFYFFF
jgi:hypothetical protein